MVTLDSKISGKLYYILVTTGLFSRETMDRCEKEFTSNTSKISLKNITKPMQKIIDREEVSKEEIQQINQEMKHGINKTAQDVAGEAYKTAEIHANDTPEEKKSKITFYEKISQFLKRIFDGILEILKECFDAIWSIPGSVKDAIYDAYAYFCNCISKVEAYFTPGQKTSGETTKKEV